MKNFATITSVLFSVGTSANAQVAFEGMEVSVSAITPTTGIFGDFIKYGLDGNATLAFGNFGAQADFGIYGYGGGAFNAGLGEYDAGMHLFSKIGDNVKFGGFYSYDILTDGMSSLEIPTYGVEIMIDLGKFDTEISYAAVGGIFGTDLAAFTIDGYFQLSESLEVNAGYLGLVSTSIATDFGLAHVGVNYQFPNMPVSIGASYMFGVFAGSTGSGAVEASVSYSFGQSSGMRSFSNRRFGYFDLILIAPD